MFSQGLNFYISLYIKALLCFSGISFSLHNFSSTFYTNLGMGNGGGHLVARLKVVWTESILLLWTGGATPNRIDKAPLLNACTTLHNAWYLLASLDLFAYSVLINYYNHCFFCSGAANLVNLHFFMFGYNIDFHRLCFIFSRMLNGGDPSLLCGLSSSLCVCVCFDWDSEVL